MFISIRVFALEGKIKLPTDVGSSDGGQLPLYLFTMSTSLP